MSKRREFIVAGNPKNMKVKVTVTIDLDDFLGTARITNLEELYDYIREMWLLEPEEGENWEDCIEANLEEEQLEQIRGIKRALARGKTVYWGVFGSDGHAFEALLGEVGIPKSKNVEVIYLSPES